MRIRNWITIKQWTDTPLYVREVISRWKKHYYPYDSELLDLHQTIELLIVITRNYHKDSSSPSRFYNNMLENIESVIAWDDDGEGSSLIDTLYYELINAIAHSLQMRTAQ